MEYIFSGFLRYRLPRGNFDSCHQPWRNTIPPGFMKSGGIIFFIEPQLFVFLKDHRNFEISIQTLFSFNKKSFSLQTVTHPSSD